MSARRRGGGRSNGAQGAGDGETPDNGRGPTDKDGVELDGDQSPEEVLEADFEAELELAAEVEGPASGNGATAKRPNVLLRLYRGETAFDFIGNRRWWFTISSLVILVSCLSFATRGLNLGIDFKGGTSWSVISKTLTVPQATTIAKANGVVNPTVVELTNLHNGQRTIDVTTDLNSKSTAVHEQIVNNVQDGLAKATHSSPNAISVTDVGPTWGSNVTKKAIEALIVFFILVTVYISIRFEFKMAVAAIVAVIHDVTVAAGVYSITGFQVTPDTVVAILTVLGYSLYDTVVVFDRIRDNSQGLGASGRITYSEMVNLSMNQTLARSINTSLVAIMPVLSVLIVGALILGATTLEDFGLALAIGLTSGAYSSIFIASPLLALMKEREQRYITIRQRIESRGDRYGLLTPLAAAAMAGGGSTSGRSSDRGRPVAAGVIRPGAAARRRSGPQKAQAAGRGSTDPNAPVTPAGAAKGGNGSARSAAGSTRPGARRPPPRPRKGKGNSKGKRRR
jgi:preprotein translocase subunit SecF